MLNGVTYLRVFLNLFAVDLLFAEPACRHDAFKHVFLFWRRLYCLVQRGNALRIQAFIVILLVVLAAVVAHKTRAS